MKIIENIIKLRPTITAFVVTSVWAAMTVYIICSMFNIIKRDPSMNFEAILAIYTSISVLFKEILGFDFGSSAGSKAKQDTIERMNDSAISTTDSKIAQ